MYRGRPQSLTDDFFLETVLFLGQTVVHLVTALDPRVAGALIHGDAVPDVLSLLNAAVL